MNFKQDNLTAKQKDYAIFLPAISSFYAGYIGKERYPDQVSTIGDRLPKGLGNMESMNWLNSKESLFPYKYSLYSAGHADMDLSKHVPKEDMVRNREADTIMLADSGGFQIAKGVWPGQWADPKDKNAEKKREQVIAWQMGLFPTFYASIGFLAPRMVVVLVQLALLYIIFKRYPNILDFIK